MQALIPVAVYAGKAGGKIAGRLAMAAAVGFCGTMGTLIASHTARHPKVCKLLNRLSNPATA